MATIEFRAKASDVFNMDDSLSHQEIRVPTLSTKHCDMAAFRRHPRFQSYANSDLFPGILARIRRDRLGSVIRTDASPAGVTVDTSGFLARVTLDV